MIPEEEIRQASIGFLLFQYYQSIARTAEGRQSMIRILDVWEYINRRLAGTSIGEIQRALDELDWVGIMRNGSLIALRSKTEPRHK